MFHRTFVLPKSKSLLPVTAAASRFDFAAVCSSAPYHQHRQRQQQQQATTAMFKFLAAAVTSAGAWNGASTATATLFSLTPHLLHARRHCSSSNTNSSNIADTIANTPSSAAVIAATATTAPTQQRVPCGFSQERLSSSKETNYEDFLFNSFRKLGLHEKCSADFGIDSNDHQHRCSKCGCTIDEHLTQQQLDARFQQQLQEEKQRREQHQEQEKQRQKLENLRQQVIDMIKQHNSKSLHWGTADARRITGKAPWGMLARDSQMSDVEQELAKFPGRTQDDRWPFLALASTPRQGKTLFGDTLGASAAARKALSGASLPTETTAARVFNVTFNDRFTYNGAPCTVEQAVQEVVVRLICAAAGIYTNLSSRREDGFIGDANTVRKFVVANDMTVPDVLQFLHETGVLPHGTPALFVFDEITKLTDCIITDNTPAQQLDVRRKAAAISTFYSTVALLIGRHRAVLLSGFSYRDIVTALSDSGRGVHFVELQALTTVISRRPVLVMLAALLRSSLPPLSQAAEAADALFHFEVLKSSPGALGSVLQQLPMIKSGKVSVALDSIGHVQRLCSALSPVARQFQPQGADPLTRLVHVLAIMEWVGAVDTTAASAAQQQGKEEEEANREEPSKPQTTAPREDAAVAAADNDFSSRQRSSNRAAAEMELTDDQLNRLLRIVDECEAEDKTIVVRRMKKALSHHHLTDRPVMPTSFFVEPLWLMILVRSAPEDFACAQTVAHDLYRYFTMLRDFADAYVTSSKDTAGRRKGEMLEDAVACGLRIQRSLRSHLLRSLLTTASTTRSLKRRWLKQEPLVVATNSSSNTKDVRGLVEFSTECFDGDAHFAEHYPVPKSKQQHSSSKISGTAADNKLKAKNWKQLREFFAKDPTLWTLASYLCGTAAQSTSGANTAVASQPSPAKAVKLLLRPKRSILPAHCSRPAGKKQQRQQQQQDKDKGHSNGRAPEIKPDITGTLAAAQALNDDDSEGGDSHNGSTIENNPLVDLIFHEYVPGTDKKRLIQFWVQVKHTTHHPIIDDRDFDDWCLRNPVPPATATTTADETTEQQQQPSSSQTQSPRSVSDVKSAPVVSQQQQYYEKRRKRDALLWERRKLKQQRIDLQQQKKEQSVVEAEKIKTALGKNKGDLEHRDNQLPRTFAERDRSRCARELLEKYLFARREPCGSGETTKSARHKQQQPGTARFVNHVHLGLSNPILQHHNCIVDHVVHIVLTPLEINVETITESAQSHLGRLQSYSLYIVNPGTVGFENLLSQPVALTAPLMDSHDVDSWMAPVPHDVSEWKDYIGVQRGLKSVFDDGSADQGAYLTMVANNEKYLKEWEADLAVQREQQELEQTPVKVKQQ